MFHKIVFLIAFICCYNKAEAQILIQKIPDENLCAFDMELMQKGYQLAYSNMTSEDYLFKGNEEAWKTCWIKLMHDLNSYMQQKGVLLNKNTACFNRIYFRKEGTIEAYIYHLKGLTPAQEQKFDELLFDFLKLQRVSIEASQNYWQYGTLLFE